MIPCPKCHQNEEHTETCPDKLDARDFLRERLETLLGGSMFKNAHEVGRIELRKGDVAYLCGDVAGEIVMEEGATLYLGGWRLLNRATFTFVSCLRTEGPSPEVKARARAIPSGVRE